MQDSLAHHRPSPKLAISTCPDSWEQSGSVAPVSIIMMDTLGESKRQAALQLMISVNGDEVPVSEIGVFEITSEIDSKSVLNSIRFLCIGLRACLFTGVLQCWQLLDFQ